MAKRLFLPLLLIAVFFAGSASYAGNEAIAISSIKKGLNDNAKRVILKENLFNYTDSKGQSLLTHAVVSGNVIIAEYLITNGADINAATIAKSTPLHLAVRYGKGEVVELLLKYGADYNLQDFMGYTPLMRAIDSNQDTAFDLLLNYPIDLNIKNNRQESVFDLAVRNNNYQYLSGLVALLGLDDAKYMRSLHAEMVDEGNDQAVAIIRSRQLEVVNEIALRLKPFHTSYIEYIPSDLIKEEQNFPCLDLQEHNVDGDVCVHFSKLSTVLAQPKISDVKPSLTQILAKEKAAQYQEKEKLQNNKSAKISLPLASTFTIASTPHFANVGLGKKNENLNEQASVIEIKEPIEIKELELADNSSIYTGSVIMSSVANGYYNDRKKAKTTNNKTALDFEIATAMDNILINDGVRDLNKSDNIEVANINDLPIRHNVRQKPNRNTLNNSLVHLVDLKDHEDEYKEIYFAPRVVRPSYEELGMQKYSAKKQPAFNARKEIGVKELDLPQQQSFYTRPIVTSSLLTSYYHSNKKKEKPYQNLVLIEDDVVFENINAIDGAILEKKQEATVFLYDINSYEILNAPIESYEASQIDSVPEWINKAKYPSHIMDPLSFKGKRKNIFNPKKIESNKSPYKISYVNNRQDLEKKEAVEEEGYFIQLGAFKNFELAKNLAVNANKFGNVYYAKGENSSLVKVLIGPYKEKWRAKRVTQTEGFKKYFKEYLIIRK